MTSTIDSSFARCGLHHQTTKISTAPAIAAVPTTQTSVRIRSVLRGKEACFSDEHTATMISSKSLQPALISRWPWEGSTKLDRMARRISEYCGQG